MTSDADWDNEETAAYVVADVTLEDGLLVQLIVNEVFSAMIALHPVMDSQPAIHRLRREALFYYGRRQIQCGKGSPEECTHDCPLHFHRRDAHEDARTYRARSQTWSMWPGHYQVNPVQHLLGAT